MPFENLDEVAEELGDGGPHNPDIEFDTVEDLVDELIDCGYTDRVYNQHDDFIGLKEKLSDEFLQTPLDDLNNIDEDAFEEEIKLVLNEAEAIIPLYKGNSDEDEYDDEDENDDEDD